MPKLSLWKFLMRMINSKINVINWLECLDTEGVVNWLSFWGFVSCTLHLLNNDLSLWAAICYGAWTSAWVSRSSTSSPCEGALIQGILNTLAWVCIKVTTTERLLCMLIHKQTKMHAFSHAYTLTLTHKPAQSHLFYHLPISLALFPSTTDRSWKC